ncbi:MAG: GEVED domain-containing protein, partial [Acidobacteriota bacterium]
MTLMLVGATIAAAPAVPAQTISGAVFYDPDASGTRSSTEIGAPGVLVSAFDASGSLISQTASCGLQAISIAANPPTIPSPINVAACAVAQVGDYALAGLALSTDYRLELTWSDSLLFDGAQGAGAGSSVQFAATGDTGVDFGVSYPEDFCQSDPRLIAGCYVFDTTTFTIPPWTPADTHQMIVSWPYTQRATSVSASAEIHPHDDDALYGDLGHILGVVVHRSTRKAIFSAIASPLWPAGSAGIGGIYSADYTGPADAYVAGSVALLADLNGVDALPGDDLVDLTAQNPVSAGVLDRFGEQGIGGIDLSADDQILWAINMGAGSLLRIQIGNPPTSPSAAEITELPIPDPGCTSGVFRPGAVTVYRSSVFIGGVCDASGAAGAGTANLTGEVIEYDGAVFTSRFSFPLDFQIGKIFQGIPASFPLVKWQGSDDQFEPQPFMTDLVFDDDGSLVLGFMPRLSYHGLVQVAGFVVRAQTDGAGGYALETAGSSGPYSSTARTVFDGVNTFGHPGNAVPGEGPGGTWFYENGLFHNFASMFHAALFSAGLTIVPGSGEVAAGFTDPLGIDAFGVRYLDRQNGRGVAGVQFGGLKVALVSDVDVLCEQPSLEIGNRVWCDAPSALATPNGLQDPPGSAGSVDTNLANVVIDLSCNGGAITAMATSDLDGNFLFNAGNVAGGIPPGATCTLSIDTAANAAALGSCTLPTMPNVGSATDPGQDLRDSDGTDIDMDGVIEVSLTVGGPGANDHTVDFGLRAPPVPVVTATKTDVLQIDGDGDGMLDAGDTLRYTAVITNTGNADAAATTYTSAVDPNTALVVGSVTTTQGTVTTGNTGGDTSVGVDIGTLAQGGGSVTITYDVTLNEPVPVGVVQISCQGDIAADNHPDTMTDDPDDPTSSTDPTTTPVDVAPEVTATKVDALLIDGDGDGRVDPGDTIKYTAVVANAGDQDADSVAFVSGLDANTTLVVGSVTAPGATVTSGNTPGDTSVAVDIGTLVGGGGSVTIMFEVTVNSPIPGGVTQVSCQGSITGGNIPTTPTDDPDDPPADDPTDTPLDLGEDFGDAPDSYTTIASPSHELDSTAGIYLGACVDSEAAGQASVGADGDDTNAGGAPLATLGTCSGGDEDGVVFDTMIVACSSAQVTVTSAGGGTLNGWIDFDGDGLFDHPGERILADQTLTGADALAFAVPCSAAAGSTYARFRVDSGGGLTPSGATVDGEVEDYVVLVKGIDLGDAPDSYGTLLASNGALHALDASIPLYLGSCVDSEADGQPVADGTPADGDDLGAGLSDLGGCTGPDDEDGIVFDDMVIACGTSNLTATASQSGLLDGWIDFDGDGNFSGVGEQIFSSQAIAAGANPLPFAVPCTAASQAVTYARFRLSTAGGLGATGPAMDGEVED